MKSFWLVLGCCALFGGADALRLALPAIGVTLTPLSTTLEKLLPSQAKVRHQ